MGKGIPCKQNESFKVSVLISDKSNFKRKTVTRGKKKRDYIL